ncbi:cation diffusion facilitator family transporter [Kushneria marisflavi]|uniref:Cation transporter n=1 Tax=Kushneria marisflavi TaxID=157779 RepID=A0A240UNZ4_9GAMM|nr:cation diffusion facilitator family transporter [Kushneria marisflavi]ART62762.1 cation transporter [Kushneria marisflavi]RKD83829.1 cobalt-zinc-cadmium efflux system protein [Kushneria marisflavi]
MTQDQAPHDHHGHHHHGHGHHHHGHHHHGTDNERRLLWAMVLTGGFMAAEVAGGFLTGSLALLADAGHMLTDSASLALAWMAARLTHRPANARKTYGYHRVQVLAAFVNGLALLLIVAWILFEAVHRLWAPTEVASTGMLAVAILGLVVNIGVFWLLHSGDRGNINIRGALLHVLGDLLGSVAAIAAAVIIMVTGWMPIDPLLSLLAAVLIARSAWKITTQSAHILLEGAPPHIDNEQLIRDIPGALSGIDSVHHVHIWSLTPERVMVTLHAVIHDDTDQDQAILDIRSYLKERFDADHITVQIERQSRCLEEAGLDHDAGHPHPA